MIAAIYKINAEAAIIRRIFHGDSEMVQMQCGDDEQWCEVDESVSAQTHYIKTSTRRANQRDASPAVLSRDTVPADCDQTVTLSRIRPGSIVTVDGPISGRYTVDDGSLELSFGDPGVYTARIEAPFPARPTTVTINAR